MASGRRAGDMRMPQAELIARITPGNTIELDTCKIGRIFRENNILSLLTFFMVIGGETGSGNSLTSNIAVLYLQHLAELGYSEGWKEFDEYLNGIRWEHGPRTVTEGITMWNRPYIIERDGKEIAFLILDTTGAGSSEHNRSLDSLLMFIKTCMSPMHIISVNFKLKTGLLFDLEYWQNYLNACKTVEGVNRLIQDDQRGTIFLLKNWQGTNRFGEDKWLFTDFDANSDPSIRKAYETVEQANSLITAFTFPHPGDKIAMASSSQNCWKLQDIPDNFLSSMEAFFEKFLELSFHTASVTGEESLQRMEMLKHCLPKLPRPELSGATGGSEEEICFNSTREAADYNIREFTALANELFRRGIQIELGNEAANIKKLTLDEYSMITRYHGVDQDTVRWRKHYELLSEEIEMDQRRIIDEYRDLLEIERLRLSRRRINVLVEETRRAIEPDIYNYISTYHSPYIGQDILYV